MQFLHYNYNKIRKYLQYLSNQDRLTDVRTEGVVDEQADVCMDG